MDVLSEFLINGYIEVSLERYVYSSVMQRINLKLP